MSVERNQCGPGQAERHAAVPSGTGGLRSPLDFRKLFAKAREGKRLPTRLRFFPSPVGAPGDDGGMAAVRGSASTDAASDEATRDEEGDAYLESGVAGPPRRVVERRAVPRRAGGGHVAVCRIRALSDAIDCPSWRFDSSPLRGTLLDVSLDGALFTLHRLPNGVRPFSAGERIALRMRQSPLRPAFDAAAIVLRAGPEADGTWKVACRFANRLPLEHLMQVGQQLFRSAVV